MSDIAWDQRELCPDGACIGVIGPDGTCKVCGRVAPNWGDERNRGLLPDPDEELVDGDPGEVDDAHDDDLADDQDDEGADDDADDEDADDADDEDDDDDDDEADAAPSDPAWAERKLCDDGACIGVIGGDGTCNVCGKRSEAA